ncbi:MAG: hypothetical protein JSR67_11745 [Proteobacteria bacterium]|nr:hypothetical protein [Pseudomonadota bacterium]
MRSDMTPGIHKGIAAACLAVAIVALTACSGHTDTAATPAAAVRVPKKAQATQEVLSPYMVSAVPVVKPGAAPLPVALKFELQSRPQPATPFEVDLAVVPQSATLARVSGKVEGQDGLTLIDGAEIAAVDKPGESAAIHHRVHVLPAHDGIFSLDVTLSVDSAGQTSSGSFAIPVIVGSGFTDLPGKSTAVVAPAPAGTPTH